MQRQVAVFGLELGDIFRRQHAERGKRHIQKVAVLVLAVFQATFQCSGFLLHMEGLIIQVNIPAVRKAESQRVRIVLAKIHQSVHFLGGHVICGDHVHIIVSFIISHGVTIHISIYRGNVTADDTFLFGIVFIV